MLSSRWLDVLVLETRIEMKISLYANSVKIASNVGAEFTSDCASTPWFSCHDSQGLKHRSANFYLNQSQASQPASLFVDAPNQIL